MQRSLRGEMTEVQVPRFEHPATAEMALTEGQAAFAALGYGVARGDVEAVRKMLDADQCDLLGAKDYVENTAVHLAAAAGTIEVLKELLKRGASVHVRNRAANTPMFLARQVGNEEAVALLREAGAHLHVEEVESGKRKANRDVVDGEGKRLKSADS